MSDNDSLESLVKERASIQESADAFVAEDEALLAPGGELDISILKEHLDAAFERTVRLHHMLGRTSTTADRVNENIKKLEHAQRTATETLHRVLDVSNLKTSVEGLESALEQKDYLAASVFAAKFFAMGKDVVNDPNSGKFHTLVQLGAQGTSEKLDETLKDASVGKETVWLYTEALAAFNWKERALEKYAAYWKENVHSMVRVMKSGEVSEDIAEELTSLLDSIALIIEEQESSVVSVFGAEGMLYLIYHLQEVCDSSAKIILDRYSQTRDLDSIVRKCQAYCEAEVTRESSPFVDSKDLDVILDEMASLSERSELFDKFVKMKSEELSAALKVDAEAGEERLSNYLSKEKLNQLLQCSGFNRQVQELMSFYIPLSETFMKESIVNAINCNLGGSPSDTDAALSKGDEGIRGEYGRRHHDDDDEDEDEDENGDGKRGEHDYETLVDDVFFILSKCIERTLGSANVQAVCAVVNHVRMILTSLFLKELKSPLGGYSKGNILALLRDEEALRPIAECLNTIEIAKQFTQRLQRDVESLFKQHMFSEKDSEMFAPVVSEFSQTAEQFQRVLLVHIRNIAGALFLAKGNALLDPLRTMSYNLTDDDFCRYEVDDPFIQTFSDTLTEVLEPVQEAFTRETMDVLVHFLVQHTAKNVEDLVLTKKFNQLGGLQFDKDVRALITYFSSIAFRPIRDRLMRLSQMASLLVLDDLSEVRDVFGGTMRSAKRGKSLTSSEVKKVLHLRVDFPHEAIEALKI